MQSFKLPVVEALARPLAEIILAHKPLRLRPSGRALFGHHHDVPVTTLQKTRPLRQLHDAVLELLDALGATRLHPAWVGRGYRPHVSDAEEQTLPLGTILIVDHVVVLRRYGPRKYASMAITLQG